MIGLNLYFVAQKESAPFPSFGCEFLSDYDRSVKTHRLHVRDAFRNDLDSFVEQCEVQGYQLRSFDFAINRDEPLNEYVPAFEIGYQDLAFFEGSDAKTWDSNGGRRIEIGSDASIIEAANQLLFVDKIATFLKSIRPEMQWRKVATSDKHKREFWRLIPQPEHSFLAPTTVVNGRVAFSWVAAVAEPPDDLFFDRVAVGPEALFHPLIVSRGIAQQLGCEFGRFPLIPVLGCNTETGAAVIRVCERLKVRMAPT